jgi:signal transduction histidine kinase
MEEVLEHGLDAALAVKAEAIADAVHMEDDGRPHLERAGDAGVAPHREGPFYFQVWGADGRTVARAAPPGVPVEAPLPRPRAGRRRFADLWLPDGTVARATELSFVARPDEDEFDATHGGPAPRPGERLTLVVAHDRRSIDGPLAVLLTGLTFAAAVVVAGILVVVTWSVRRGLRPLADVSALADRIGPDSLDVRFPGPDRLPPELAPIGQKLNELLDRLAAAFARERRFSAAVAHELRTPLAELQASCDVALRWPDDHDGATAALAEARAVAVQMGDMVRALLALARTQAGVDEARSRPVQLSAAVAQAWAKLRPAGEARGLTADFDVGGDDPTVHANPHLLAVVLRNLLGNAVEYATPGGRVRVCADGVEGAVRLRVGNSCDTLGSDDLPRLFEPFWRKSAARSDGTHVGLGLSIVDGYCRAMGVSIAASWEPPDWFEMALTLPAASPAREG